MGVSRPELLSSLSNYCLTRRRAQCSPYIKLQHPPTVAPTPWLNSKTAPSQRTEITLLLTLTPSPSQLCLRYWRLWGRGSWGGGLRRWEEDRHTLIQAHTWALICCEMLVKLFNLADIGLLVEGLCSSQHHRVQLVSAWRSSDGVAQSSSAADGG